MQNTLYAEMLQDDPGEARERERIALDRSLALMKRASISDATQADVANAITFSSKLWCVLIEDLAAPDNGLPRELKAQVVSIGIWILRELERIRAGEKMKFDDVIEVTKAIRIGLL